MSAAAIAHTSFAVIGSFAAQLFRTMDADRALSGM